MGIKEYLPHDVINKAILSNYSFKVYNILPIKFKDTDKQRAVYKIETDAGPKCLKKVYFNEASLLFVYSVMEWLFNAGINIPTMLPTKHGGRYIKYKNNLFIVTDWINGRKCDYDIGDDICAASLNLGKIHKCSYGFIPIEGSFVSKDIPDWYRTFNRRYLQLLQFYNLASALKDDFSKSYLRYFDYFSERAQHAVHIFSTINSKNLIKTTDDFNTICHLDYVNKNIIITDDGKLYVIDFDKCKIDLPVHDLGVFLKRILKRKNTSWDFNILMMTLKNYESQRSLSSDELLALYSFLEFPQKYWKISRDYYNNIKECNKKIFNAAIFKICEQKKDHDDFCDRFKLYLNTKYNVL